MGLNSYEVYYATCSYCEKEYEAIEEVTSKTELATNMKQDGWIVDVGDDLVVCPDCVKKELKNAMQMLKDE